MWATTKLMDLAEKSLTGSDVPFSLAAWTAGMVVLVRILSFFTRMREDRLGRRLTDFYCWKLERAYLSLKLSEPPAGSQDADRVAMLHEAGVHAGKERAYGADGGLRWTLSEPKYRVRAMCNLLNRAIGISSELSVAWVALGGTGVSGYALLVVFLPWIARAARGLMPSPACDALRIKRSHEQRQLEALKFSLDGVFKRHVDEVHMLEMRDFLLEKWENTVEGLAEMRHDQPKRSGSTLIDTALSTFSWFLITTKLVSIDASLGSLIVIHHVMEDLNWRLSDLVDNSRDALNHVCFVLPFFAAQDERDSREALVDYETTRGRVASPAAKERILQRIAESMDLKALREKAEARCDPADNIIEFKLDVKPATESKIGLGIELGTDEIDSKASSVVSEKINEDNRPATTANVTTANADDIGKAPTTSSPTDKRVSLLSEEDGSVFRVDSGVGSLASEADDQRSGMAISISGVSVSYPDGSVAVKDVSLEITTGETLAIVGHNGSGKTTLIKALLGLLRYDGSIKMNGVPLQELDPASVARRIATVFQGTIKHGLTLREEISIGSLPTPSVLPHAVKRGGATPILDRVDLDTTLSQTTREQAEQHYHLSRDDVALGDFQLRARNDTYLSGGEWQRVALSRAFMRTHADLIVFDEPTAALDPRAESELFENLLSLGKRHECTTIFISHGFGNVRRADKIAFMERGTIVEYGTHEELIALAGRYHEFYSLQANRFK